jgi:aryl-alcohol dehydrogenase-like predicted oxidoreductase
VRAVDASLRRLNTDRIDVLYLHHYDAQTALDDTLKSLELLVQQGKIPRHCSHRRHRLV